MFSSGKLLWVAIGLYGVTIVVPGLLFESMILPQDYLYKSMVTCAVFCIGLAVGTLLLPFRVSSQRIDAARDASLFYLAVAAQVVITIYVFAAGPTSPLWVSFTSGDAFEVALAREAAIKLNQDYVFVRMYTWGRDIVAPIVLILGVHMLRAGRAKVSRFAIWVGVISAVLLGLWSGQKATIFNYALAAVIFSAGSAWSMVKGFIKLAPLLLIIVGIVFAATLPQLFEDGIGQIGTHVLFEAVIHRLFLSPLEVASAYLFTIDQLEIISRFDVLPLGSALWTPGIVSIENKIAMEFFYSGIDSVSANAAAFAYAYVLAGFLGCFLAGILVVGIYKLCIWWVQSSGCQFAAAALGANLCYLTLDLLNSNYLQYLISAGMMSCVFWILGSLFRATGRQPAIPAEDPVSLASLPLRPRTDTQ